MLAIILGLGIILFAVIMIFLEINKEEIWSSIKFKDEDEDDN